MSRLALVPIALAMVAGCASPPAPQAAAAGTQVAAAADPGERKQICVREQPIGSAIPATKCHYEETGVERALNLDAFQNSAYKSTRPVVPGSGN